MNTATKEQNVTMVELLDRVLAQGVVLSGDLTISVADVDLIFVGVRLMLVASHRLQESLREPADA